MKYLRLLLSIFLIYSGIYGEVPLSSPKVVERIEQDFALSGTLKQSGKFTYVDVEDRYIHELLPLIVSEGFDIPPYFGRPDSAGAHITVIYPGEAIKYGVGRIEECGEKVTFSLKQCEVVKPKNWKEMEELYLIVVEAPELDKIRQKYALPSKRYPFHITVGVKPKIKAAA